MSQEVVVVRQQDACITMLSTHLIIYLTIHTRIYTHTRIHITRIHKNTHTHTYIYIHIYIYIYAYNINII